MWHEYLFRVLEIVNYVVLTIVAIPLALQIFYILFFFLPKRKYPVSDKKARIAYLCPAHNEEGVIASSIEDLLQNQDYPKELIDVFVVAHNCVDATAEIARKAGAKVLVLDDPDPAHAKALYPLRYGIEEILSGKYGEYEMVVHLDADNHLSPNFSSAMNDAYQAGVDLARPYEGASNGTQNFFTKACAMFYVMESRYGSRVRERLGLAAHVNGSGAMMSARMLRETGGYDPVTVSDDAEYYFNRLLDGYHGHFVEDAVVYEDMPSSLKDTYNRNKRIGSGSTILFKKKLPKLLARFFKTGDFSCLEVYLTYLILMVTVPLSIWLPIYYVYHFLYLGFAGYGGMELAWRDAGYYQVTLWISLWSIVGVVLGLFLLFGYVQAFVLALTEYRKLGGKNRLDYLLAVPFFPFFLLLYGITIAIGALSKPKGWGSAKRNPGEMRKPDSK